MRLFSNECKSKSLQIYYLTDLEPRRPTRVSVGYHGVDRAGESRSPSGASKKNVSLPVPPGRGCLYSLVMDSFILDPSARPVASSWVQTPSITNSPKTRTKTKQNKPATVKSSYFLLASQPPFFSFCLPSPVFAHMCILWMNVHIFTYIWLCV